MPHLHLPIDHTEADLVLAVNLAEIVGSENLYVAWTYDAGPGAVPEVIAVLVERRPTSPIADLLAALGAGLAAVLGALRGRPRQPAVRHAPRADPARRTAGEPRG